ncbi:3-keto-5-aminohexanoate cleavage enzyme [Geodia barretti]|uniref:3-keto-5-aminohexanoate cleavage enzyme n=1 Tax=Geodia barretti TaxID=519541 RepID=A0AA35TII7_GEOBA|nr:3-keto-5-aminohexanoate cleavage enzyme [Geodia barretti]
MGRKVIITCAVTGSADTVAKNPAVPVTPTEIAQSALDAAKAGAAIVHVHVRDPESGKASMELDHYRETAGRIRQSETDVVLNLTTGYGARLSPGVDDPFDYGPGTTFTSRHGESAHVGELRPEICSLDVATMNSGGVRDDSVMINSPPQLRYMADAMREWGVVPELEVFDVGHSLLPAGAHWAAFGISRDQLPVAGLSVLSGGHVRTGLEDNLYVERGTLAPSNAALVEQAVSLIRMLGAEPATPAEAREILCTRN